MNRSLRIVVADDDADLCESYRRLLRELGHDVVVVQTGRGLVECCRLVRPDLVITDVRLPDLDGIEAAEQVYQGTPVPILVVSGYQDPDLIARAERGPVMGYLVKPIDPDRLGPTLALAVRRFDDLQASRRDAAEQRQALEDRKVLERAKGVVMTRIGVGEPEAFRRLRQLACDQNRKMTDIARAILSADEVFARMEQGALPGPVVAAVARRAAGPARLR